MILFDITLFTIYYILYSILLSQYIYIYIYIYTIYMYHNIKTFTIIFNENTHMY